MVVVLRVCRALVMMFLAVALVASAAPAGAAGPAAPAGPAGPVRPDDPSVTALRAPTVMSAVPRIVLHGDSLTMGSAGDWTWRFRLAQSLDASGQAYDFVGPRSDVFAFSPYRLGSHRYRHADFDQDHASLAGMRLTDGDLQISALSAEYRPDAIVSMIGFNDLLHGHTVEELAVTLRTEIVQARAASPGVDLVLVQLPQVWFPGVRAWNDAQLALAEEMDNRFARVVVTERADLVWYTDTWDHVHPSAAGERKIAAAVADSLQELGIGAGAVTVPDPALGDAWAPDPVATPSGSSITVTWPVVDYASSQNVHVHDVTTGSTQVRRTVTGTSVTTAAVPGHTYRIWLAPVKGYLATGDVSSVPAEVTVPAQEFAPAA